MTTTPGYERKLLRADVHIDALDEAVQDWLDRGGYTLVEKTDAQTGYQIICAEIKEPPDPDWPLIIGDAVHNLRSALDHIAFDLTVAYQEDTNPGQPISRDLIRSSEFPVIPTVNERTGMTGDAEHRFDSAAGSKLAGVHPDARAAIKAAQPYHRGAQSETHELWLVHDLDRVDKHRELIVTAAAAYVQNLTLGGTGFFPYLWIGGGAVEHGTKVAEYAIPTGLAPHMQLYFTRHIAFGEGTLAERFVVPTLRSLRAYLASELIPVLEPWLPSH